MPSQEPADPTRTAVSIGRRLSQILEAVATGQPLDAVLELTVELVEAQMPGSLGSILLLDARAGRLRFGAGRQLAGAYAALPEGVPIGPRHGSCGTAAFTGAPVIVADTATDPLWADFRDFATANRLGAAWSFPIFGSPRRDGDGRPAVIGTMALYHREPACPEPAWLAILADAAHLAGVAIERATALRTLEDREARYRTIVENVQDAVFVHDEGCAILDVNRRACESLGYTRDELLGVPPFVYDPDLTSDGLATIISALERTETLTFETRHRRKDGTAFPVEVRISGFFEGGRRLAVAVARDITARKLEEGARQRTEEQARVSQKMEAIGRLAGGIAHDFNNLLTVISGHCELLLTSGAGGVAPQGDLLAIRDAAESAARLTGQLLSFSRQAVIEPRLLDVNDVVRATTLMLGRLLGETVSLQLTLAPLLYDVRADAGQLEQVIVNLTLNGRDAMPEGGTLTITTEAVELTTHEVLAPGSYVALRVTDTGVGMTEAVKARVFEPFFTTKDMGRGTGLGLATVFGIVAQAGGTVQVDSTPQAGSTFTVLLPAVTSVGAARPAGGATAAVPGGHETILVAEDEEGVRRLTERVLTGLGYRVITGRSGLDAVAAAEAHDGLIDALLTDVVMPDLGGRALADRLRARQPSLRVLFMSGYTDDTRLPDGAPFLPKPFTASALASALRAVLDAPAPGV